MRQLESLFKSKHLQLIEIIRANCPRMKEELVSVYEDEQVKIADI